MQRKKQSPEQTDPEAQKKVAEERQKLVVQVVRLPNGATFTRLKPVFVP